VPADAGATAVYLMRPTEPFVDATFDRELAGGRPGPREERASIAAHRAATFVLEHLTADAERCFASALAAGPMTVGATFVVEAGGRVAEARAESADVPAASCLQRAITARTFPDPGRAVRHRIVHDFVLGHR
jgi:hypothetical protein